MAKILIVDDSETQRFQLKKELEKASHLTIEACDGADGLSKLKENPDVQLIVCDVNMPVMDGLTMCSKISEMAGFQGIPVFMLTTEASAELRDRAKKVGVRAWITKPFNPEKLLAAVAKVTVK